MAGFTAGLYLPKALAAAVAADTTLSSTNGPMGNFTNVTNVGTTSATFTLTISAGAGAVGFANLGGVTAGLTATWATSDTATCTALAAQLNALATVNTMFSFAGVSNTVVVTSLIAGSPGNFFSGQGTGTGVTPNTVTAFSGGGSTALPFTGALFTGGVGDINRLLQVLGSRYSWQS